MTSIWKRSSAVVLAAGLSVTAPLAHGASPLTLEQLRSKAEKLAPPYPTLPGKTACVCRTGVAATSYFGYLNSFVNDDLGDQTMNLLCVYPVFAPGLAYGTCTAFEVIK
jgi:hypothetical protein